MKQKEEPTLRDVLTRLYDGGMSDIEVGERVGASRVTIYRLRTGRPNRAAEMVFAVVRLHAQVCKRRKAVKRLASPT